MSEKLEIILHTEVQLLDWGETRTGGPYIKLRLADAEELEAFRGMDTAKLKKTGHIFNMTLAAGDIAQLAEDPKKGIYGAYTAKLHRSSFFSSPDVWAALGTDKQYRTWIQQHPKGCMICNGGEWVQDLGENRCEAAHVLRADLPPSREGDEPNKPDFSRVPLCNKHHTTQHNQGEYAALVSYDQDKYKGVDASDFFRRRSIIYVQQWAHSQLRDFFGAKSLTELSPEVIKEWAESVGVERYLPMEGE